MESMLASLVSSQTRVKLLLRLFGNPDMSSYLREMSNEFGVSTNSVRGELNRLCAAKLLTSAKKGREVHYRANRRHPLFVELVSMAQKSLGLDRVVDSIVARLGELDMAFITGDYAEGRDTGVIDLVLVGDIDRIKLGELVSKTEEHLNRKVRTLCLSPEDYRRLGPAIGAKPHVMLWQRDKKTGAIS